MTNFFKNIFKPKIKENKSKPKEFVTKNRSENPFLKLISSYDNFEIFEVNSVLNIKVNNEILHRFDIIYKDSDRIIINCNGKHIGTLADILDPKFIANINKIDKENRIRFIVSNFTDQVIKDILSV